jgi:hypothetical protein
MNLSKMKYDEELATKFKEVLDLTETIHNDMELGLAIRQLIRKHSHSKVEINTIKYIQPENRKDNPHHHENRQD